MDDGAFFWRIANILFNPAFGIHDNVADLPRDLLEFIQPGFPPAFMIFGSRDEIGLRNGRAMLSRIRSIGQERAELLVAEGQSRGFFNVQPWIDITLAEAERFLAAHGIRQLPVGSTSASGRQLVRVD